MKQHYNRYLVAVFFMLFLASNVQAQNNDELWSRISGKEISKEKKVLRTVEPTNFKVYQLNLNSLKNKLVNAPNRNGNVTKSSHIISFPSEKGVLENYEVFETTIMEEALQKKYPNIKAYIGKSVENPGDIIRFSITSSGLHAMLLPQKGDITLIDPYTLDKAAYLMYNKKDYAKPTNFECKVEDSEFVTSNTSDNNSAKANNANDGKLRTFRLAIAATGEYSQYHLTNRGISATATDAIKKEAVLSAIITTIDRVNSVFERDVALTMLLVDNTDIIFLDGATDPFTNDDGGILINESQTQIDAIIGTSNYDIGHTFSTGGGGLASLNSPCTSSKARGITGLAEPIGDYYAIDFVAHEMGHQFGATHTFNNSCNNNRTASTAVEPGSGSTIMSYAGICAPNIQNTVDPYFHLVSIRQMWANITSGNSTCGATNPAQTVVNVPVLTDLINYTIPISTPFVLTAAATDADGDALTYSWEQLDTEIATQPPVANATGGPAFRAMAATSEAIRYFPDYNTVVAGNLSSTWEVLPSVARTMQFGVTVRDENVIAAQTASKETTITFDATAGPFEVTYPAAADILWRDGTTETVTWAVANTNVLSGAATVDILLSTDGGATFPTTLASNTPNDGSEDILVPNIGSPNCRIMIQPTNHIFYAMNLQSFAINYLTETTCTTYSATPNMSITDNNIINEIMVFDETSITVPTTGVVSDVNVTVGVTHTWLGDLRIELKNPNGTQLVLFDRSCGPNDHMNVTFDDAGAALVCATPTTGTYMPSNLLSAFNGEVSNGTWTIGINDNVGGDTGTLNSWSIEICSTVETSLAVGKFEFDQFKVYPNPSNGQVTISFKSNSSEDVQVNLYDLTGRLISATTYASYSTVFNEVVNFGSISTGMYLLKVTKGANSSFKQVAIYR